MVSEVTTSGRGVPDTQKVFLGLLAPRGIIIRVCSGRGPQGLAAGRPCSGGRRCRNVMEEIRGAEKGGAGIGGGAEPYGDPATHMFVQLVGSTDMSH